MWLYFAADDQHCDSVECESKKVGPVSTDLLVSLRVMDGHSFKACSQVRQTLRSWTQSFAAALPKLDNVQLCKTQSERCKVEYMMLCWEEQIDRLVKGRGRSWGIKKMGI